MKHFASVWVLLPLACLAAACGDDDTTSGSGGSSSSTGSSATSTSGPTGTSSTSSAGQGGAGQGGAGQGGDGQGGDGQGGDGQGGDGQGGDGQGGDGQGGDGQGGEGGSDFVFEEPIDVPADDWTFVDFPESRCLDDSPTGIGVNPSSSNDTDLVIYLEGGGACFNGFTCGQVANPDGYDADDFAGQGLNPLLTRESANPFEAWSMVYVPYCSGDVHAGDTSGEVGGAPRRFRGYANMRDYLERLVPTFPNVTRVLLSGSSAGGFGAAYNYDQVKRAFGSGVDVVLLDDSGPPMRQEYVPPCLQDAFRATWGLDATLPQGCTDCFGDDTFMEELMSYITAEHADQRFGLISSDADFVIRSFWSFGNNDCAQIDGLLPGFYPASKFEDGVIDIRDTFGSDTMAVFMPSGTRHVWLSDDAGLGTRIGDSPTILEWVEQLVEGDPDWQSWPE